MTGAAVRFYVVCIILQRFVFDAVGVPFPITVVGMTLLIWLYTRRGGIKTLVWTDTFQTTCMFAALLLIIYNVTQQLGMSVGEAVQAVAADEHSRMFVWDDWVSTACRAYPSDTSRWSLGSADSRRAAAGRRWRSSRG